jgi:hypothetical protein
LPWTWIVLATAIALIGILIVAWATKPAEVSAYSPNSQRS